MMKKWLRVLTALMLASMVVEPFTACARSRKVVQVDASHADTASAQPAPQQAPARAAGKATFLDTLNQGKEVYLKESELAPVASSVVNAAQPQPAVAVEGVEGFRVQCLASSQIETVRGEKRAVESRVKQPAYIVFNDPYYKLMVGDFVNRGDAEKFLAEFRAMGYTDAWIVKCTVSAKQ